MAVLKKWEQNTACLPAGRSEPEHPGGCLWGQKEEASETPLRPRHPQYIPCPGRIWHRTAPTACSSGKALTTTSPGHPERLKSESHTPKTSSETPDGGSRECAEAWGNTRQLGQGESAAPDSTTGQRMWTAVLEKESRLEQLANGRLSFR